MRNPVSSFTYVAANANIKRSSFQRNQDHKTTMSAGRLYPIFVDEYLPGDTFSLDTSVLARMSTPIHPVMDNCYLDIMFFAVPNRLVWEHWEEFMGASPDDPYLNPIEYSIPQLTLAKEYNSEFGTPSTDGNIVPKSVLDYLGAPSNTAIESMSALPVRAFCRIWNEWFRDENLMNAIDLDISDTNYEYYNVGEAAGNMYSEFDSYVLGTARGGPLPPVAKYHDYFTSALKQQQKGDPVPIPLNGFAPVFSIDGYYVDDATPSNGTSVGGLEWNGSRGSVTIDPDGLTAIDAGFSGSDGTAAPSNLFADLGSSYHWSRINDFSYSTINDLRYAFQMQKLLEADNRYGTRYIEQIKGHFNVDAPQGLLQRTEFLGGKRIRVNMNQVLQNSATTEDSPQGNTAAYSLTADVSSNFTKSFYEHGWIIGVACIRTDHTYSQGLEKMFLRKDRYSFYFPEMAHISEQPILNKEIFNESIRQDTAAQFAEANEYFGFQEAWAEYRYKPNRISGEFRPTYPQSLDIWHYGDDYASQPYLSGEWVAETRSNIDRTLAVSSDVADQFILDFYFKINSVRPMPIESIPGYADHF